MPLRHALCDAIISLGDLSILFAMNKWPVYKCHLSHFEILHYRSSESIRCPIVRRTVRLPFCGGNRTVSNSLNDNVAVRHQNKGKAKNLLILGFLLLSGLLETLPLFVCKTFGH
jgi:hypothetical protein